MKALSLVHLVHQPSVVQDTLPLLLLLHGIGSNEHDLFGLIPFLDNRFLIISVRAPYTLGTESYGWFNFTVTPQGTTNADLVQAEASRETLITFINEAVTAYGVDPKQVYLMGFSQGAIMSASVALTRPDLVAGVVLMSGRIVSEMLPPGSTAAKELEGLPFLVVHGTDDTVIPISLGRASQQLLSSLPVKLTYHEYAMRHEVSGESLTDVATWLSGQLDAAQSQQTG